MIRLAALLAMLLPVGTLAQVASQKQLSPGTLPHDCMVAGECPQSTCRQWNDKFNAGEAVPCPRSTGATPPKVDRSWHVLTITYGGIVSLLKGLTKHEADYTCDRAMGRPATAKEKAEAAKVEKERVKACADERAGRRKPGFFTGSACTDATYNSPGDIKSCEVFQ